MGQPHRIVFGLQYLGEYFPAGARMNILLQPEDVPSMVGFHILANCSRCFSSRTILVDAVLES